MTATGLPRGGKVVDTVRERFREVTEEQMCAVVIGSDKAAGSYPCYHRSGCGGRGRRRRSLLRLRAVVSGRERSLQIPLFGSKVTRPVKARWRRSEAAASNSIYANRRRFVSFRSSPQNTIVQSTRRALARADLSEQNPVHEGRFVCTCAHYSS